MATQYLSVTWSQYHTLSLNLAATILSHNKTYEVIIAIARGGLSLGLILSDLLKTPVSSITIQSYTDIQKQGELTITSKLGMSIKGKKVLLVDDIADSGKTFKRSLSYLKRLHPTSIATVALFYKPHSTYRPDFYAKRTSAWILLPHEVTEWIYTFTKKMEAEGKSKAHIQRFLESLGYNDKQIAFVRKYHLK
ncbi:phosphoribosyltransferase [Candidatus Gottesmanbacteria bacterium]|nr:phosphoribosyltransferase [Candidatus Gottesmanbacteria bacterium]